MSWRKRKIKLSEFVFYPQFGKRDELTRAFFETPKFPERRNF